jgi:hypothetical protein
LERQTLVRYTGETMANRLMDARAHQMPSRSKPRARATSVLFRQRYMKLRVALVCLVWGEEFADFFAGYCVPSLLEPHNIPLVSREHDVTLLLYTDRATRELLDRRDSFNALSKFANVEWLPLGQLPPAARTNHWVPWQHAVAGRSGEFDLFLVIIPDCVYAAGCLGTIVDALKEHDTVYYRLPQVCKETVAVELDGLRRVDDHEYIGFTSLQAVELFIRHVNPKHAAAACSGAFFINHPEYVLQLSTDSMVVSESSSHPLAIRSSTPGVSYTFGTLSADAKTCYLEILGVSAEPTAKFVEQYYRWPKLYRDHSRLMNLGGWAWHFRDASTAAYSNCATHITLDRGRALEQRQGQVRHARTQFLNVTLEFLAAATRLYDYVSRRTDPTAAKYVALAIAAPGFHRHLRRHQSDLTIILPKEQSKFEQVVQRIQSHPAATAVLRRFLLLHVIAHRLTIEPDETIFLTYPDAAQHLPKAYVVDPDTIVLGSGLWVKDVSLPRWVWKNVFCTEADVDYSCLTWSMLDPVNGTSERVLPPLQPIEPAEEAPLTARDVVKLGAVRAYNTATKLPLVGHSAWLGRNLYRNAKGRPWLSLEDGGLRPRLPKPPCTIVLTESARVRYDAISKLNIVDNVIKVTLAFYERLGFNSQQSPVYRCLGSIRSRLAEEVQASSADSPKSTLERFEVAWRAYEAGKVQEAFQLLREVMADEELIEATAADPRAREAYIRAAEILGRDAELRGDTSTAAELYHRVIELFPNGIVARRLLLMLWREARIQEAAKLAPRVLHSACNLVEHLRGGDMVADLTRRIRHEARREPTTARGPNDRDFGLPAR